MTHAGAFHNTAIGGVWALHQAPSFATNSNDATLVRQALSFNDMRGFCLRIPWNSIETSQGVYSFTSLNNALSVVREFPGKKFAVRPISGRYTPSYIYDTLGVRNYPAAGPAGGRAPHPCNADGTPQTVWLNRFLPFMQALFDWAATKAGDVSYVHGSHFSNQYSEFYHGTEVRTPNQGYDASNVNFINAHKVLWSGVYNMAVASGIATEFGMSGTHVEDIQIAAVEYLHTLTGDWGNRLVINANGVAGTASGGTDWGSSTSETQQDQNCGFSVNGVFNPPAARRVTRMGQMIQPGAYSASYWHNVFLTTRANRSEGVEIYIADGQLVGAPGTSFGTASSAVPLQAEISQWAAEIIGSPVNDVSAIAAGTLPHVTSAATAHRWVVATTASTVPSFVGAATGIRESEPPGGIVHSTLAAMTQTATGTRAETSAASAQSLPAMTQIVTGTRANPTSGTGFAVSVLAPFTQSVLGEHEFQSGDGAVASVLPALSQQLTGAIHLEATSTASLSPMQSVASGASSTFRYIRPVDHIEIVDGPGLILPDPPPERPEAVTIGCFKRDGPPGTTGAGSAWGSRYLPGNYVKGFVVNVLWSDLQPDEQGQEFQTDDIDVAITQAIDLGIQLKVRLFFGGNAPTWAKILSGGPMTIENPQTPGDVFFCGIFWDSAYIAAVNDVYQQFFERYNQYVWPNGPLRDVVNSGAMTRYAEPCLRQNSLAANRAMFTAHGYTLAKDLACHRTYIDQMLDFPGVASTAFNAFQVANTIQNLPAIAITLMDYARESLGLHAGIGNNSDRTDVINSPPMWPLPGAQKLYDAIENHGAPTYIQTAAEARVGNLYQTCLTNVDRGVTMMELPGNFTQDGVLGMTPDQFDTINEGLLANAVAAGFPD